MKQAAERMNDSTLIQNVAEYKAAFVKRPEVILSQ